MPGVFISPGGISGRSARRSCRTSAAAVPAASSASTATAQPGSGSPDAADSASSSAVDEAASSSSPARSNRPPSVRRGARRPSGKVRGSRNQPARMPSAPIGTLIQNAQRQEAWVTSSPPRVGPRARPRAWAAAWMPSAVRIARSGTPRATRATLLACIIAPPTACTARQATSTVRLPASPAPSEAAANTAKPPRYMVLRPTRSDSRPTGASSATSTSRYDSDTHATAAKPASKRRSSAGNTSEVMLAVSWPRNAPRQTVPTASQCACGQRATARGRGRSARRRASCTVSSSRLAATGSAMNRIYLPPR